MPLFHERGSGDASEEASEEGSEEASKEASVGAIHSVQANEWLGKDVGQGLTRQYEIV